MARNLKKDYLKKLIGIRTNNGYKVDVANYIYNPSHDNEYPSLVKILEETEDNITISRVYYFKYYDGTGEYLHKIEKAPKSKDNSWVIVSEKAETKLEANNRFNLNKLIQYAEAIA
jgi:hypothetical protein